MKSIEDFIVSPLTKRYENEIDVEGVKLITNTNIESYKQQLLALWCKKDFKIGISQGFI